MGYFSSNSYGEQTDLHRFYNLSSSIDKVSFKSSSMSLGLVLLEEKLFTRTPQSDAIMSADIKMSHHFTVYILVQLVRVHGRFFKAFLNSGPNRKSPSEPYSTPIHIEVGRNRNQRNRQATQFYCMTPAWTKLKGQSWGFYIKFNSQTPAWKGILPSVKPGIPCTVPS